MVFLQILLLLGILAFCVFAISVGVMNIKIKNSAAGLAWVFFGFLPLLVIISFLLDYYLGIEGAMFMLLMPISFGFALLIIFRKRILGE